MIDDFVGKLIADKYRIESLIREGETGDLYAGRHEVLDKPVTVKILPAAFAVDARWVKRFVDDARAASSISHTNVLGLTDFGTDARNVSYAVFEPAEGSTLRDRLAGEPAFDERRALDISRQIAAAVVSAHAKTVVHGSLSPKNVFVTGDDGHDVVKVYGFGGDPLKVARDADPQYLAPEQCGAFPRADERSDVYSLGVMLYEMLSGVVPFDGATAAEVMAKQNTEPPPPLSAFRRDLHPEIEPIVLTAIAADPDRRYQTMEAFAEDIDILSGRLGIATRSEATAAGVPAKRNVWQTAFIALVGIFILAAALIYATSVRKTDPTTDLQADAGSLPVQPIGPATGAQEENLAKMPAMTDAEIIANGLQQPLDTMPGGDGYNAWANGGAPPIGAPMPGYAPPTGQVMTVDPNGQFMPPMGIDLRCKDMQTGEEVPCPNSSQVPAERPAVKPSPTPKTPPGNAVVQPTPASTPKPMATPPPKNAKPATDAPGKDKPSPGTKPAGSGKPKNS